VLVASVTGALTVQIQYSIVFTVTGSDRANPLTSHLPAGTYSIRFNASDVSPPRGSSFTSRTCDRDNATVS
jgi:hypothetical protein